MNDIDISVGGFTNSIVSGSPLTYYRSVDPFVLETRIEQLEMEISELRMMLENITIEARNAGLLGGPPSLSEILKQNPDDS